MLAEKSLELRVTLPEAEGAAKGPGNQQVALDVASAPGEELEAALAVARRLGGGAVVAVEDAEGPDPRSGAAPAAKVLERALRLSAGSEVDPSVVEQLRAAVGGEAAAYVHWGATSQDIVDTGLVLRLRGVAGLFADKIERLSSLLAKRADEHRGTVMAARTRSQQALPTSFGLKVAVRSFRL